MTCDFLNDAGIPSVCFLQAVEAGLMMIVPFVLYRIWALRNIDKRAMVLPIFEAVCRRLAFCSSAAFTLAIFSSLSRADLPTLVVAASATALHDTELRNRPQLVASTELLLLWTAQTIISISRFAAQPSGSNALLSVLAGTAWSFEFFSSPWKPQSYDEASVFGKVSMSFLSDLIRIAKERTITDADFPGCPESIGMEQSYTQFLKTFNSYNPGSRFRVLWTLMTFYKWRLILVLSLGVVVDLVSYTQPLLLAGFLKSLQGINDSSKPFDYEAVYFACGIGLAQLAVNTVGAIRQINSNAMFLNSRTALMESIYRKALSISSDSRDKYDSATIMNLLNVDTSIVQMAYSQITSLISAPIGLILCTVQLYAFLGEATLAAVPLYLLYMPYSSWATKRQLKRFPESMRAKDQRAKSTLSVMRNMKSLKLYAWEDPYEKRVFEDRERELDIQWRFLKLRVAFRTVTGQLDNLVVTAVFLAFLYLSGDPLTPEIVFPALSMISLVSDPLFTLPSAISELGSAFTSQGRILQFLEQPEETFENYHREPAIGPSDYDTPLVEVIQAKAMWGKHEDSAIAVQPFSLELRRGDLCCILGKVGSGKSALLKAFCSQLYIKEGSITTRGPFAYASQEPWLQYRSLRDNVLFGLEYDEEFYRKTIKNCELESDIALFADGDLTEIGEKGISLSGGQKARVSLARAVYSRADIVVLDDVLSAVDHHVSGKLLKNLFASDGMLASKAVILATHTAQSLKVCSHLLCVSWGGRIIFNGSPHDADASAIVSATGEGMETSAIKNLLPKPDFDRRREVQDQFQDAPVHIRKIDDTNPNATFSPQKFTKEEMLPDVPILAVYKRYLGTVSKKTTAMIMIFLVLSIVSVSMVSVWLSIWSGHEIAGLKQSQFYVDVFLVIVVLAAVFDAASYYTFFGTMALQASQTLHDQMLDNVIHAPMAFFERTPLGALMSRFTADVATLDSSLPRMMYFFLNMLFTTSANLAIATFGSPLIILILLPMTVIYNGFRASFVPASRQLQKLISASSGPLLSHIEESIRGVATLTVFDARDQFIRGFEQRGNYWAHATFLRFGLRRWLNSRIALMTATVVTVSALSVVILVRFWNLPVSVAGIVLHGVRVAGSKLSRIIASWTQIEVSVVGVERVFDYMDLPNEAPYHVDPSDEPALEESWPSQGVVQFKNFSTKFRPELDDVLHDINISISEREKIGIVGRTGAGKSTLTMALFRILEATSGNIVIDDVDTSQLGLFDLRSRLSIIPQEAQIFKGSLRQNLDPLDTSDDTTLWRVLELCHLKGHFEHGLDTEIIEGGDNISRGQAQLICLGRALIRSTKILVLDEATASVDTNTDSLVQSTIRQEFSDRTIITIAHRLDTVMDSDKILVLAEGRVVEFDTPQRLLEQKGYFYELAQAVNTPL